MVIIKPTVGWGVAVTAVGFTAQIFVLFKISSIKIIFFLRVSESNISS